MDRARSQRSFDPLDSTGFYSDSPEHAPMEPAASDGTTRSSPSLFELSANLAGSMARFARGGFRIADKEVYEGRLAVCRSCSEHLNGRCSLCGCFVAAKAKLQSESCPAGRWTAPTG